MPRGGNKSWDFVFAYYPPEELTKTPSNRMHHVWELSEKATTAGRALTKFWQEVKAQQDWGKEDIVLLGIMPLGLPPRPEAEETE